MPTWNTDQYLKFARERTQPSIDLAARVDIAAPARVIDLGCGPGNSTAVVAQRWPHSKITGVDSSPAMLTTARRDFAARPEINWLEADIADVAKWSPHATSELSASPPATSENPAPYDVIFTNAALQWVPDHATLLPHIFAQVAPGGAFAMQVPMNITAPTHRLMRELAASPAWREFFLQPAREWHVEPSSFYYNVLAPFAARIDLWQTDYIHVLPDPAAIVEWYRGTGLRPWLDALPDDATRERFLADYLELITAEFPRQADGRVLFPFLRLFLVAYQRPA